MCCIKDILTMEIKLKLFLLVLGVSDVLTDDDTLVEISNGKVQGFLGKSYKNRVFSSFRGIPYARPPVGELRFEPPKEPYNWTGILIANRTYQCVQVPEGPLGTLDVSGTEDCLFLNVYVPREKPISSDNLPVIVHFHGGAFMVGSGNTYAGPKFLMDEDVILVTMNYRLGPFGFLSTEDKVVPGNMGMKDQVLSLKWIQKNIKYFGGDPNSVTITGMSAGAVSVHLHYFSPLSKGLFHRGFSESGNVFNPWAIQGYALEKAKRIANAVGCPSDTSIEIITCLKTKSAEEIIKTKIIFSPFTGVPLVPAAPVVEIENDGAFLTSHPYKMLIEKKATDLPWVQSIAEHEGSFFALWFTNGMKDFLDNFENIVPHFLFYNYTVDQNQIAVVTQKIMEYYFPNGKNSNDLAQLIGDRLISSEANVGTKWQAIANKSPVYLLVFAYKGQNSLCDLIIREKCDTIGASHGDDALQYLNLPSESPPTLSPEDEKMKDIYIEWLTTFAKTGEAKMPGVKWEPVTGEDPIECLFVRGPNDIRMEYANNLGSRSFWKALPFKKNQFF